MNVTDIVIPAAPAGVVILINFFAPYVVSLVSDVKWPSAAKKWVAIGVALLLAGIALVLYYVISGDAIPSWPSLLLLGVVVTQFSYSVVLKDSADKVTESSGVGAASNVVSLQDKIDAAVAKALADKGTSEDSDTQVAA